MIIDWTQILFSLDQCDCIFYRWKHFPAFLLSEPCSQTKARKWSLYGSYWVYLYSRRGIICKVKKKNCTSSGFCFPFLWGTHRETKDSLETLKKCFTTPKWTHKLQLLQTQNVKGIMSSKQNRWNALPCQCIRLGISEPEGPRDSGALHFWPLEAVQSAPQHTFAVKRGSCSSNRCILVVLVSLGLSFDTNYKWWEIASLLCTNNFLIHSFI